MSSYLISTNAVTSGTIIPSTSNGIATFNAVQSHWETASLEVQLEEAKALVAWLYEQLCTLHPDQCNGPCETCEVIQEAEQKVNS